MAAATGEALPKARLLRIHEAAAEVGLTPRSVRYYEEVGLLTPLIGIAFVAVAYVFWRLGLNRYQGVGH